jgi:hypothetical protein
MKMEETLWIEDIVASPSFFTILELTWLVSWILTRWLLKGVHLQPFQVHEMKVNKKRDRK